MELEAAINELVSLNEELGRREWRLNDIEQQLHMAETLDELKAVGSMLDNFNRRGDEIAKELDRLKSIIRG